MSREIFWSIDAGDLLISGRNFWRGRPDGLPVLDIMLDRDREAAFILLDPPAGGGHVRNLLLIGPTGDIRWRAELPDVIGADAFVSMAFADDGSIVSGTWSGYRVRIDPASGRLLEQTFTK